MLCASGHKQIKVENSKRPDREARALFSYSSVAYLKASPEISTSVPANELAGYPSCVPTSRALGYEVLPLRGVLCPLDEREGDFVAAPSIMPYTLDTGETVAATCRR